MNETNLLAALALASFVYTNSARTTNWVNTGDMERRNGTNYIEQYMSEINTTEFQIRVTPVVTYITNRVALKISREVFSLTNTPVIKMTPSGPPPLPPTPGVPTKL
jgi:hypothetical protein